MPKDLTKEQINIGEEYKSWEIPEFTKHDHPRKWYITMGIIVAVLLVYSFVTANILFSVIIIITSVIILMLHRREPEMLDFMITNNGILVGNTFYEWSEIKNFWLIYEPPEVKTLYFEFKAWHLPRLPIPMQDQKPNEIREILLEYIDEDLEREGEPISDNLGRKLKIQ